MILASCKFRILTLLCLNRKFEHFTLSELLPTRFVSSEYFHLLNFSHLGQITPLEQGLAIMSYRFTEEKRRPQPITFPLPPPPRPPPVTDQQRQQDSRNASDSTQRGQRSANATPMISPVESRPPVSGSGRSRTAMATFTNLIDQARVSSPRKSEHGSWTGSNVGSTARSRQSGRSQDDAVTAQAQLEALDEETARGKMESRAEKNLFKMTGQIPPTPTTGEYASMLLRPCTKHYRFCERG